MLCGAAQLVGLGVGLLEQASAYVGQRRQFGRPVGEFQAVKHHLANVHVALEFARPLVHGAAVTGAARDVSAAKVAAGEAAYRAARAALQVHGAIGFTPRARPRAVADEGARVAVGVGNAVVAPGPRAQPAFESMTSLPFSRVTRTTWCCWDVVSPLV